MNKSFGNPRYAVMRHARNTGHNEQAILVPDSVEICRRVIAELAVKILGKSVSIFHSPLRRAELTAELVRDVLDTHGISVIAMAPLDWLKCDSYAITDEKIAWATEESADSFILFITHQPDIEGYLGIYNGVSNCSIFAAEFTIKGH